MQDLAPYIEHTLLRPEATRADYQALCAEAHLHGFRAVCVPGSRVDQCRAWLEEKNSPVQIVSVAGFPLGQMDADAKRFEVEAAIDAGAHEIDYVLNIGWLKDRDTASLLREMRDLVDAAEEHPIKVILETALLTSEEKSLAARVALEGGASFVKTSTGFAKGGATIDDVRLLKGIVENALGIKAAGGVKDPAHAWQLIEAGATRIGTSSGVALVQGHAARPSY